MQDLDKIHALEGFCSLAASGASSVKGGNFQIFEHFLARSGAKVHLNTTVRAIFTIFTTIFAILSVRPIVPFSFFLTYRVFYHVLTPLFD